MLKQLPNRYIEITQMGFHSLAGLFNAVDITKLCNAFVSGAVGLRFKSWADQIEYSVATARHR